MSNIPVNPPNEHHSTQNLKGPWQIFKMNNLIVSAIPFRIIVLIRRFIESPMMTSYQKKNAQVLWLFYFWELHGGKGIYVEIPERLFNNLLIFWYLYVLDVRINRAIFNLIS